LHHGGYGLVGAPLFPVVSEAAVGFTGLWEIIWIAMKTSAIIVRVADFLKSYPPFASLAEESLLRIANSGRVRFHEKGEVLYVEGAPRDQWLYMINSGSVRLTRRTTHGSQVFDLRGKGDLLGVGGYLGETRFEATAEVEEDAILYALDLATVIRECAASPNASRFFAMFFATSELGQEEDLRVVGGALAPLFDWSQPSDLHPDRLRGQLIATGPGTTIREAAEQMSVNAGSALVVVDREGHPLGIMTETDLRDKVATGRVPVDAPVSRLMRQPIVTIASADTVGDALLTMMRHNCRHLVVTHDGTAGTRATGLLSERELMLFYGNNPLVIIQEIHQSEAPTEMREWLLRMEGLLQAGLRGPADVEWYMEVMAEAVRNIVGRIECLCRRDLGPPPGPYSFVLTGSLGRRENLARTDFTSLLFYLESGPEERAWYVELHRRVTAAACQVGFSPPRHALFDRTELCCRSVREWGDFFERLIADPLGSELWRRLTLFDLRTLDPGHPELDLVKTRIREALARNKPFVRLLANDCYENLPPLTIYEGFTVQANGLQVPSLDIKQSALRPLVDVARVFHLASGPSTAVNTLDRFRDVGGHLPVLRGVLEPAARAFKVASYFRSRNGLTQGDDGSIVKPATLTRTEQVMLKSAFRAVGDLLQAMSEHFEVG